MSRCTQRRREVSVRYQVRQTQTINKWLEERRSSHASKTTKTKAKPETSSEEIKSVAAPRTKTAEKKTMRSKQLQMPIEIDQDQSFSGLGSGGSQTEEKQPWLNAVVAAAGRESSLCYERSKVDSAISRLQDGIHRLLDDLAFQSPAGVASTSATQIGVLFALSPRVAAFAARRRCFEAPFVVGKPLQKRRSPKSPAAQNLAELLEEHITARRDRRPLREGFDATNRIEIKVRGTSRSPQL